MTRARDLAKGTFSGDLTVDTNTLVVDSANNRVGVGTASPASTLHAAGSFRQTGATVPFEWTVNAGAADFLKLNAVGYADNLLVATSSGNVGIGTSSPKSDAGATTLEVSNPTTARVLIKSTNAGGREYGWYSSTDGQFGLYDYTASAERMRIDSAGRVTMPYQPAFSAYMNTQNITNAATYPSVAAVEFNIGGHYNSANGRFTAPINGSYLFTATVQLNGSVKSAPHTNFFKNGAAFNNGWLDFDGASASSQSRILYLSAGDYVELVLYAGVTVQISGERTKITGHLIG